MKTIDILTFIFLGILLVVSSLLSEIGAFRFLYFHLLWAIVILVNYRDRFGISFAGIILLIGDLLLGLPVGIGILSVGTAGLVVSLLNKIWPILRSQPFWLARILWLLISLLLLQILLWGTNIVTETQVIAKILLVNIIVFGLLSLLTNRLLGKARYADIIIK